MALVFQDIEGDNAWVGEWPLPNRPKFIRSQTFEILSRELRRYTSEEVRGRSFLIAGHRGAGKTTLVLRAVEDVRREAIRESVAGLIAGLPAPPGSVAKRPQRPLLVKVHGPSLLTAALPNLPKSGEQSAAQQPAPSTNETDSSKQEAHAALVQITIALYRALASEVADAFNIHAQEEQRLRPRGRYFELAGQLALALDKAPDPASLRGFWQRLGRLAEGVLWPRAAPVAAGDQGVREIIAVATAAQAFQVCSGAIKYTETEKGLASREASVESKGQANLKETVNSLIGLAAGVLVGLGVWTRHGVAASAAAGIGAGLLSALTLSWSSKRSIKNERQVDYSFILDRSIETLERELPLVIQRIRAAGLAPVFVVDELDKVDELDAVMHRLVPRLKHLVADFSFFCFLTDRDYYEMLQRKLQEQAYPREHTYFSHRLFIAYRPIELRNYVYDLIQSNRMETADRAADELDRAALARFVLHRAKLSVIDVVRELADLREGDRIRVRPGEFGELLYYRFPIALQLAIEHILQSAALRARVENEPHFAQLATDALYLVSRDWEEEQPEITLERSKVALELLQRLRPKMPVKAAAAERELRKATGGADLELLIEQIDNLVGYLTDLHGLRIELEGVAGISETERSLLSSIPEPPAVARFLQPVRGGSERYRFLFDSYGRDLVTKALARRGSLSRGLQNQISVAAPFVRRFVGALDALGADVPARVDGVILPAAMNLKIIEAANERVEAALRRGRSYSELASDLPILREFRAQVVQRSGSLTPLLLLAFHIARDSGSQRLADVITALARYLDLRDFAGRRENNRDGPSALEAIISLPDVVRADVRTQSPPIANQLSAAPAAWGKRLADEQQRIAHVSGNFDTAAQTAEVWKLWVGRLSRNFAESTPAPASFGYADVVLAAAGRWPGNLFQRDIRKLSTADWSLLCWKAFPADGLGPADAPPVWAFVAALYALGFGQPVIEAAIDKIRPLIPAADLDEPSGPRSLLEQSAKAPTQAQAGTVILTRGVGSVAQQSSYRPEYPVLALPGPHIKEYDPLLIWLQDQQAITGVGARENPI